MSVGPGDFPNGVYTPSGDPNAYVDIGISSLSTAGGYTDSWSAYYGPGQRGIPKRRAATPASMVGEGQHNANFYNYWRQDAAWRSRIINYGLSFGIKAQDTQSLTDMWNKAGKESAFLYTSTGGKVRMTPEQILKFWSGSDGKTPGDGSGGGGGTYVSTSSSSSVSYDISDAKTAKALTNAVLTAALGREATADELEKYKKALNSYEKSNPSRSSGSSTTTSSAKGSHTSSSSTSYSGASAQGREQTIKDEVMDTTEAQAWTNSNLFQAAMDRLASRIG